MKAQIGDYVRKDGCIVKVIGIEGEPDFPPVGYLTDDGGCIGDSELGIDDVLLESEACELLGK